MGAPRRILMSWSSGKDGAWALHRLMDEPNIEIAGLLTTITEGFDRVSMHGVRRALLRAQADALGLPVWEVPIPPGCVNEEYERRMERVVRRARYEGATHVAFGDIFLEDVRSYREERLAGTGIEPLFPIWSAPDLSRATALEMIAAGLGAVVSTVDPRALDPSFAGREFDEAFLDDIPDGVDPLGENGEFHTFCHRSPDFSTPVAVDRGEVVTRDGFVFADLVPGLAVAGVRP